MYSIALKVKFVEKLILSLILNSRDCTYVYCTINFQTRNVRFHNIRFMSHYG